MPHPQFSLQTLLWLVLVVAAFLGGRTIGIQDEQRRLRAEVESEKERLEAETRKRLKLLDEHLAAQRKLLEADKGEISDALWNATLRELATREIEKSMRRSGLPTSQAPPPGTHE